MKHIEHGWIATTIDEPTAPAGTYWCPGCDCYCDTPVGRVERDCGGWIVERWCESCAERIWGEDEDE